MRPKAFSDILANNLSSVVTPAMVHHTVRALAKLKMTSGWENLSPLAASWMVFTLLGCQKSRYLDVITWVKDRQADEIFNADKDKPVWALAAYLIVPSLSKRVQSIGFTRNGVMMVLENDDKLKVFPRKMVGENNNAVDTHTVLSQAHNAAIIPGHVFRKISSELGIVVPGAMKEELEKVYA